MLALCIPSLTFDFVMEYFLFGKTNLSVVSSVCFLPGHAFSVFRHSALIAVVSVVVSCFDVYYQAFFVLLFYLHH